MKEIEEMKAVYFIPYILPIAVIIIAMEVIYSIRHNKHLYEAKDSAASAGVGIGAVLIQAFTKIGTIGAFFIVFDLFQPVRESLGYTWLGTAWWVWILCILGDDFNFYWHHRFAHTVRVLWAAHIPHHSSEYFNFGTSFRNGWTIFFFKPIYWLWMPAVGFHPAMVFTALAINSSYQFLLHSVNVPHLGWYEKIFNTPQLHQIHHSKNFAYMDKNYGGIFIFWDKLFGTFHAGRDGQERHFGVTKPPNSYNPFVITFHEYGNIWGDVMKAKSLKDKLNYIFQPPGWSPDKSTLTVKEMSKLIREQEGQLTDHQKEVFGYIDGNPDMKKELVEMDV